VVLLHGFGATPGSWEAVEGLLDTQRYTCAAPDLRPPALLPELPPGCVLCGYSMGGRIALQLALAAPERVAGLVLVSTTAGIEGVAERAQREQADDELAAWIETHTIAEFADRWMGIELFAGTPPAAAAQWREDLLRSTPAETAATLRTYGAGHMPAVWDRLGELRMPATVLVGERDAKYRALGARLANALPDADLEIARGAGHGLPREAPDAVATAIQDLAGR